jgi:2,3-bisphosphoglycerate-independent phosphoglycerate mutase
MGIVQEKYQVVFRCNLVNVDNEKMVDFSAGHIDSEIAAKLIETLDEELGTEGLRFYPGIGYRHILSIDTRKFSYDFPKLNCTPPHDIMGQSIAKYLPEGEGQTLIRDLMESSQDILNKHAANEGREFSANMIWLWGQGVKPTVDSFYDKFSLKGSVISAVDLVKGIGHLVNLEVLNVPGITGYYDTDYAAKSRYAVESLKEKDFVFVHIEATDEAGHNGDAEEKIRAIENADAKVIGPIMQALQNKDHRILVAPDHATPVDLRTHTEEYVPFVMAGTGLESDGSRLYDETVLSDNSAPSYDRGCDLISSFLSPRKGGGRESSISRS